MALRTADMRLHIQATPNDELQVFLFVGIILAHEKQRIEGQDPQTLDQSSVGKVNLLHPTSVRLQTIPTVYLLHPGYRAYLECTNYTLHPGYRAYLECTNYTPHPGYRAYLECTYYILHAGYIVHSVPTTSWLHTVQCTYYILVTDRSVPTTSYIWLQTFIFLSVKFRVDIANPLIKQK